MHSESKLRLQLIVYQTSDECIQYGVPLQYYLRLLEDTDQDDHSTAGVERTLSISTECDRSQRKETLIRIGATAFSMLRHRGVRQLIDTQSGKVWHI